MLQGAAFLQASEEVEEQRMPAGMWQTATGKRASVRCSNSLDAGSLAGNVMQGRTWLAHPDMQLAAVTIAATAIAQAVQG